MNTISNKEDRMLTEKEICSRIPKIDTDYDYVGIRIVEPHYDDYDAQVGDILEPSYEWIDGESTGNRMGGVCALDVSQLVNLRKPRSYTGYAGDRMLVIGGYHAEYGVDDNEIIIKDAEVLMIIDKETDNA